MKTNCYQRTDVKVFKKLLSDSCFINNKKPSKKKIYELIKNLNKSEILIRGLDIDIHEEMRKLNIAEFGFKISNDVKIEFVQDIFGDNNKIILTPKIIYNLEDKIDFPVHIQKSNQLYIEFMNDTFERVKIKAENVINETEEEKHIELYAKKNIQLLHKIFYDSRNLIKRVCQDSINSDFFRLFVLNTFIYNAIIYYQNMFSNFYKEPLQTKKSLKLKLFDSIGLDLFLELADNYIRLKVETSMVDSEVKPIVWNGQINTLITLFYDLKSYRLGNNTMLLDAKIDDIKYLLNKYVIDKNGNPINKNTIRICFQEYRVDKRTKGNKRIDISKYINI